MIIQKLIEDVSYIPRLVSLTSSCFNQFIICISTPRYFPAHKHEGKHRTGAESTLKALVDL